MPREMRRLGETAVATASAILIVACSLFASSGTPAGPSIQSTSTASAQTATQAEEIGAVPTSPTEREPTPEIYVGSQKIIDFPNHAGVLGTITGVLSGAVAFSSSGEYLAVATESRILVLGISGDYGAEWKIRGLIPEHDVTAIEFVPGDDALAVKTEEGIHRWHLGNGVAEVDSSYRIPGSRSTSLGSEDLEYSPDGRYLALATPTEIVIWAVGKDHEPIVLAPPGEASNPNVTFSPDGRFLAAIGEYSVAIYRSSDWKAICNVSADDVGLEVFGGTSFVKDGNLIMGDDTTVISLSAQCKEQYRISGIGRLWAYRLATTKRDEYFLLYTQRPVGGPEAPWADIELRRIADGQLAYKWSEIAGGPPSEMWLSPGGQYILIGDYGNNVTSSIGVWGVP